MSKDILKELQELGILQIIPVGYDTPKREENSK